MSLAGMKCIALIPEGESLPCSGKKPATWDHMNSGG